MGHHVRIYGEVEHVGKSSISLLINANRFNFYTKQEETVCSTRMTFVKIDDEGNPIAIGEELKEKILREAKS